ncbi:MAG: prepilin-type N-terminal cleavage/methylation domain-containing protein [Kiritimatiellia bacterium]
MRRGFTLIELLIVLAILATMMAIIVPSFSMVPSVQISMAAKDSLRLMRYARNMALQTQQPITITFSPGSIALSSPLDDSHVTTSNIEEKSSSTVPASASAPSSMRTAVQGGSVEEVAITKYYDLVGFEFLNYTDNIENSTSVLSTEKKTTASTFSITIRTNGTMRPFKLRVHEKDDESGRGGDVISFDFLCSGTIENE